MGFNFRKSINLGLGTRLNLSKSGLSASVGVKGARIGVGPKGTRVTGSVPGTGMYYTKNTGFKKENQLNSQVGTTKKGGLKFLFVILLVLGFLINSFSNIAFNIYLVICLGVIYCIFQTCLFSQENIENFDIPEVLIEIFSSLLILGIGCYIASSIAFYIFMGMFLLNVIITIGIYKTNKCELEEK